VVREGPVGRLLETKGLGEDRGYQFWVARRRQVDEGDPIGEACLDRAGRLHGQARLARPPDAGERDQPRSVHQQVPQQADVVLAAHEARQGVREGGSAAHAGRPRGGGVAGSGERRCARDLGGRHMMLAAARRRRGQRREALPLIGRQVQGNGQPPRRVGEQAILAAFEVLDVARAQPGALGQRLLRQPRRQPILLEQHAE